MNALQREAMAAAQDGRWNLADALEIEARCKENAFGECAGGIRRGGRLQWLAYCVSIETSGRECEECFGSGRQTCPTCEQDSDCEECDGTGKAPADAASVDLIADLNDRIIWALPADGSRADEPDFELQLTPQWAADVLQQHAAQKAKAAAAAATQATLIPETT